MAYKEKAREVLLTPSSSQSVTDRSCEACTAKRPSSKERDNDSAGRLSVFFRTRSERPTEYVRLSRSGVIEEAHKRRRGDDFRNDTFIHLAKQIGRRKLNKVAALTKIITEQDRTKGSEDSYQKLKF